MWLALARLLFRLRPTAWESSAAPPTRRSGWAWRPTRLQALAERVREELTARDVPFDPKPFRPHITLGRRVRIPKKPLPPLAFPLPAHARTVTLFKSTLSRDGAEYKPLYTVELGEPAEMPTSTPN